MEIIEQQQSIPFTAFGMHRWQLDAWEKQDHPNYAGLRFEVCRGQFGNYDGYVLPLGQGCEGIAASTYVHGWLNGRESIAAPGGS